MKQYLLLHFLFFCCSSFGQHTILEGYDNTNHIIINKTNPDSSQKIQIVINDSTTFPVILKEKTNPYDLDISRYNFKIGEKIKIHLIFDGEFRPFIVNTTSFIKNYSKKNDAVLNRNNNLKFRFSKKTDYTIYDDHGHLVKNEKSKTVNRSDFKKGVYYLVYNENTILKFINK